MAKRTMTRSRRQFRRQKREYIWASVWVTHDTTPLDGTFDGFTLVDRNDWCRDPGNILSIEKGATLLRIIGDVRVRSENAAVGPSAGGASYVWGIGKRDEDDGTVYDLNTFFGEDWMHVEAGSLDPNNATSVAFAPQVSWRHPTLDIKSKRRLTSEDVVEFHFGGSTAQGGFSATELLVVDYMFRSLIALP